MTREDAIKELQESHDMMRSYNIDESESRLMTALNMAIQALKNHDTFMKYAYSQGKQDALSQEPCDAISREAVKNMLWKAIEDLEDLPSLTNGGESR